MPFLFVDWPPLNWCSPSTPSMLPLGPPSDDRCLPSAIWVLDLAPEAVQRMLQSASRLSRCVGAWRLNLSSRGLTYISTRAPAARRNPQAAFPHLSSCSRRGLGRRRSTIALAAPAVTETVEMEVGPMAASAYRLAPPAGVTLLPCPRLSLMAAAALLLHAGDSPQLCRGVTAGQAGAGGLPGVR